MLNPAHLVKVLLSGRAVVAPTCCEFATEDWLFTKIRANYRGDARIARPLATLNRQTAL